MAMLEGKSGIVTGAAQGFGRATAERLCARARAWSWSISRRMPSTNLVVDGGVTVKCY
jgi:NAD(P)-dependent dehydrogenase (short-subunit alcohol dehydrogenase family)